MAQKFVNLFLDSHALLSKRAFNEHDSLATRDRKSGPGIHHEQRKYLEPV